MSSTAMAVLYGVLYFLVGSWISYVLYIAYFRELRPSMPPLDKAADESLEFAKALEEKPVHPLFKSIKDSCSTQGYMEERSPFDIAKELGVWVVEPGADYLMLDLDNTTAKEEFVRRLTQLRRACPGFFQEHIFTVSKSGKGWHAYVKLRDAATPLERLGLQAILCSDSVREFLSLRRLIDPDTTVPDSVLFEKPDQIDAIRAMLPKAKISQKTV